MCLNVGGKVLEALSEGMFVITYLLEQYNRNAAIINDLFISTKW